MDTIVHLTASVSTGFDEDSFDRMSALFGDRFEGMLGRRGDQLLLTVYITPNPNDAERDVLDLIHRVETTLDVAVVELDLDLVSVSDIAERTGRSRQSIRLLADGSRGPGGFPVPLGTPGGSKVWDWDSVNSWLKRTSDLGDAEVGLPRGLIYKINAMISGRLIIQT